MNLFWAAFIFAFIIICLVVLFDWLNYVDLQRRLRKERQARRKPPPTLGRNAVIIEGIALEDIDAFVPVVISESSAPGEALFVSQDVFDHLGEIDPRKAVKIVNLEEEET